MSSGAGDPVLYDARHMIYYHSGYVPLYNGCPYCGAGHVSPGPNGCPRVKRVEYFENGTIKAVEFHPAADYVLTPMSGTGVETSVIGGS